MLLTKDQLFFCDDAIKEFLVSQLGDYDCYKNFKDRARKIAISFSEGDDVNAAVIISDCDVLQCDYMIYAMAVKNDVSDADLLKKLLIEAVDDLDGAVMVEYWKHSDEDATLQVLEEVGFSKITVLENLYLKTNGCTKCPFKEKRPCSRICDCVLLIKF